MSGYATDRVQRCGGCSLTVAMLADAPARDHGPMSTDPASTSPDFRVEHDTMGEVRVPARAKWRAQTQRAVENFPISGRPLEPAHVHAIAQIKAAAAKVNARLGVVDDEMAR